MQALDQGLIPESEGSLSLKSDYGKVQSLTLQVALLSSRLGQAFAIQVHEFSKGLYSKKGKVCAPSKAINYSAMAKLSRGRILPIYLQPKRAL